MGGLEEIWEEIINVVDRGNCSARLRLFFKLLGAAPLHR